MDIEIDCGAIFFGLKQFREVESELSSLSTTFSGVKITNSEITKAYLLDESKTIISNLSRSVIKDLIEQFEESKTILENSDAQIALLFDYYEQGIINEKGEFTDVPLMNQDDYGNIVYSGGTIASSGCGLTSLCMVASFLLNDLYTPDELAAIANADKSSNVGKMTTAADYVGLNWYNNQNTSREDLVNLLSEGNMVICLVKGSSHFVVCKGITEDGKILVNDPYSPFRTESTTNNGYTMNDLQFSSGNTWVFNPAANTNSKVSLGKVTISEDVANKLQNITLDGSYEATVFPENKNPNGNLGEVLPEEIETGDNSENNNSPQDKEDSPYDNYEDPEYIDENENSKEDSEETKEQPGIDEEDDYEEQPSNKIENNEQNESEIEETEKNDESETIEEDTDVLEEELEETIENDINIEDDYEKLEEEPIPKEEQEPIPKEEQEQPTIQNQPENNSDNKTEVNTQPEQTKPTTQTQQPQQQNNNQPQSQPAQQKQPSSNNSQPQVIKQNISTQNIANTVASSPKPQPVTPEVSQQKEPIATPPTTNPPIITENKTPIVNTESSTKPQNMGNLSNQNQPTATVPKVDSSSSIIQSKPTVKVDKIIESTIPTSNNTNSNNILESPIQSPTISPSVSAEKAQTIIKPTAPKEDIIIESQPNIEQPAIEQAIISQHSARVSQQKAESPISAIPAKLNENKGILTGAIATAVTGLALGETTILKKEKDKKEKEETDKK